jgi:type II secretory pathway pseudopilin PulG
MKIWILAILAAAILAVYAVPTFYEAGTQRKVIRVARTMAEDLMQARFQSLSGSDNNGIRLVRTGRQAYTIFSGDKVIKTAYLDQTDPTVVYSSLLDTKGAVIEKDSFIFKTVRNINEPATKGHDSIFFNDKTSEEKGSLKNIIRLYIDKDTYNIKLFRVYEVKDNGDLVFKEI